MDRLGEGVYRNMPMSEYQADPCVDPSLTRGIIRSLITECPAKVKHDNPRLNPAYVATACDKFDIGTMAHSLFLEGIDIAEVLDFDDWRTKASKEARDAARSNGKIPLLRHQYTQVKRVVEAAEKNLAESELGIKDLRAEGESEIVYIWQEEDVWCRIRPDWLSNDGKIILDFKTTGMSAAPSEYARNIISTGIDIQSAFYPMGVEHIDGIEPKFILMVQEVEPPFLASFISLSPQFHEMGLSKIKEGMASWSYCLMANEWAGYPQRIAYLDAPPWALSQWEERKFSNQLSEQGEEIPF